MFYVMLMKYNSITPAGPSSLGGGQLYWVSASWISEHLGTCAVRQAEISGRHPLCRSIKHTMVSKDPEVITTFWDALMLAGTYLN